MSCTLIAPVVLVLGAGAANYTGNMFGGGFCGHDVCIHVAKASCATVLTAVNQLVHTPMTVSLDLTSHGADVREVGAPIVLEPGARQVVATLSPNSKNWAYDYQYYQRPGPLNARHDRDAVYRLPVRTGQHFHVMQSCNGQFLHKGKERYAIDLAMQRGTPIHAARSGRVIDVVDRFGPGGPSRAHLPRANFIRVLHEDGMIGL